jgi:hypothetical protein
MIVLDEEKKLPVGGKLVQAYFLFHQKNKIFGTVPAKTE